VHQEPEAAARARQGDSGGGAVAIAEDFGIDQAGGAIDRDIGVAELTARRRQVFGVSMDEAGRGVGLKEWWFVG